jgi:hypothetical protein
MKRRSCVRNYGKAMHVVAGVQLSSDELPESWVGEGPLQTVQLSPVMLQCTIKK